MTFHIVLQMISWIIISILAGFIIFFGIKKKKGVKSAAIVMIPYIAVAFFVFLFDFIIAAVSPKICTKLLICEYEYREKSSYVLSNRYWFEDESGESVELFLDYFVDFKGAFEEGETYEITYEERTGIISEIRKIDQDD
ncbi:MAG: hypothetical protein IJO29_08565 [Oscillospiraceae bacterium]|nr:hypothetical protein [Oscillospiraceae bacterium]